MSDLGASVKWPKSPAVLANFSKRLKRMHEIWRANVILSKIPDHLRQSLHQKLASFEAFNGKRLQWGYARFWKGDYLSQVNYIARFLYLY